MAWFYADAVKRENLQTALQAELNYQAMVVALSAVLNRVMGGQDDIPEKLGLMEALEENQEESKTLTHYKEDAPDVLSVLGI